jgi:hypothetical protein
MRAYRGRDLVRLGDAWSDHSSKSWSSRVVNADSISKELTSLGAQVKTLINVFMVSWIVEGVYARAHTLSARECSCRRAGNRPDPAHHPRNSEETGKELRRSALIMLMVDQETNEGYGTH